MGTLFLKDKVEQPYFLKYCKRNPALTYRHGDDFSLSLLIYRSNDNNQTDIYAFQLSLKETYDAREQGKLYSKMDLDFYSLTYADFIENAKDEILDMAINLEADAILLREKCKDDDSELFADIFYTASLYLKIASRGKEIGLETPINSGKSN